jgi:hypothetical protein
MPAQAATFRANKAKIILVGGIPAAVFLVCLVLSLGLVPDAPMDTFTRVLVGVGVLFFGLMTLFWSKQLFDSGVVLEVSEEGIKDRRYSSAVIPWNVIENIRMVETTYSEFLSVEFPGNVQAKMPRPWYRKLFDFINPLLGYRGMQITMNGLNGTFADLAAAINAVAPQRLKNLA